jgi:hypothetical protein
MASSCCLDMVLRGESDDDDDDDESAGEQVSETPAFNSLHRSWSMAIASLGCREVNIGTPSYNNITRWGRLYISRITSKKPNGYA